MWQGSALDIDGALAGIANVPPILVIQGGTGRVVVRIYFFKRYARRSSSLPLK